MKKMSIHTQIACGNLKLEFAIGDLEIAASREGLQYSDYTIKNINTKIKKAASEMAAKLKQNLMLVNRFGRRGVSTRSVRRLRHLARHGNSQRKSHTKVMTLTFVLSCMTLAWAMEVRWIVLSIWLRYISM